MTCFLTSDYFIGDILIPNLADATDSGFILSDLRNFIGKREPEFFKLLLGKTLYQEFLTGMSTIPVDNKWTALYNMLFYSIDFPVTGGSQKYESISAPFNFTASKGELISLVIIVNKTNNSGQLSLIANDGQVAFSRQGINGGVGAITPIPVNKVFSMIRILG